VQEGEAHAMAEAKTKPTKGSVADYLAAVEPAQKRADAQTLLALMTKVSGETATLWGPSIIGFGTYHYKYESGREGDMCRIGFSPRKANLVIYILDGFPKYPALLAKLGKHKTGSSCLYINKLADVDLGVLETLMRESLASMDAKYPR
jgi:hypothetical protein